MQLHRLVGELDPRINLQVVPNVEIQGICEDSRIADPGDLFVARAGTKNDGAKFVGAAIGRGVAAVLGASKIDDCPVPQIVVDDPSTAAARLAHIFHEHPSSRVRVVGITGTNGKTTTTYLIRHILNKADHKCGIVGTVETDDGRSRHEAAMTTPSAIELARLLAEMRDNGCRACAMETSSHALHQKRVEGIHFVGGAFTNLTPDHLDYHENMENYAAAKALLFESLDEYAVAVLNGDDPWSERMALGTRARVVRFGFGPKADYRAKDFAMTNAGSRFVLDTPDGNAEVALTMVGRHNIANTLTAAAICAECFGLSVHRIAGALRDFAAAPGRLQPVRLGQPFAVLVDYAHTPDALEKVLETLRPLTRGKLRVLFGCGGDRDRKKRPLMAQAVEKFADHIYLTSDNPRSEDPDAIIEEITAGFADPPRKPLVVEADRRSAIAAMLDDAEPNDVLLLAGKGHENYQIVGQTKHHFDDVEEVESILRKSTGYAA